MEGEGPRQLAVIHCHCKQTWKGEQMQRQSTIWDLVQQKGKGEGEVTTG